MNLSDYFNNLFQKADGVDPQAIIDKIQNDFPVQFYVDSMGFNDFQLKDFIQEPNCGIIFHQNDGFDKNFRINFINNLPQGTKPSEVFVINTGFDYKELKIYAGLEATIVVANADGNIWHRFKLEPFSLKVPGKIIVIPKSSWYSAKNIHQILKEANINIHIVVKKEQYSPDEIKSFINIAKGRIEVDKEGFDVSDLETFKSEGATII